MKRIEISPAPDLYEVEFAFERQLGISVLVPATCALGAKLKAWRLFPEHKRNASRTTVHNVEYAEIDWQTGRTIVVKGQRRPRLIAPSSSELEEGFFNDWSVNEEGTE